MAAAERRLRRPWRVVFWALPRDGSELHLGDVLRVGWAGYRAKAEWSAGRLEHVTLTCPRGAIAERYRDGRVAWHASPLLWAPDGEHDDAWATPGTEAYDDVSRAREAVLRELDRALALLADELNPSGRPVGKRDAKPRAARTR